MVEITGSKIYSGDVDLESAIFFTTGSGRSLNDQNVDVIGFGEIKITNGSSNGKSLTGSRTGAVFAVSTPTAVATPQPTSAPAPPDSGLAITDLAGELGTVQGFADAMFSCSAPTEGPLAERTCVWSDVSLGRTVFDPSGASGFTQSAAVVRTGGQIAVTDAWFVGAAIGLDKTEFRSGASDITGYRARGGVVVKYVEGPFAAGLALTAGGGEADVRRQTGAGNSFGEYGTVTAAARARVAYRLQLGPVDVVPSLAGSITYLDAGSFRGSGGGGVTQAGTSETIPGAHVAVAISSDLLLGPYDTRVRPELALGADWYGEADFTASAVQGATTFTNTISPDDVTGWLRAGLKVFAAEDVVFSFAYRGGFGADTISHAGTVELSLAL